MSMCQVCRRQQTINICQSCNVFVCSECMLFHVMHPTHKAKVNLRISRGYHVRAEETPQEMD